MEVLLLEDMPKVGKRGQTVRVADGFARNFLVPRKLAVIVDAGNRKMLENERRKIEVQNRKRLQAQQLMAEQISSVELEFVARAREGVLYGSVSVTDILDKLNEKGYKLEPKQVLLDSNIKQVGTHSIPVRFKDGIQANLTIHVISEE